MNTSLHHWKKWIGLAGGIFFKGHTSVPSVIRNCFTYPRHRCLCVCSLHHTRMRNPIRWCFQAALKNFLKFSELQVLRDPLSARPQACGAEGDVYSKCVVRLICPCWLCCCSFIPSSTWTFLLSFHPLLFCSFIILPFIVYLLYVVFINSRKIRHSFVASLGKPWGKTVVSYKIFNENTTPNALQRVMIL